MTLIQADAFHLPYPDKLFHAIVTSPPYWGLRKYQGDQGEEPLGLEATPERHIERMVEVFREVRRVLRDDGVVWLNYGDCFSGGGRGDSDTPKQASNRGHSTAERGYRGIQQGNLMFMPHRLAIELQADGWIVRNDLVWFKRNPMPESVAGWRWERKRKKVSPSNHSVTHNIKGGTEAMLRDASIHQGISPEWLAEYEYSDDYVLRKSSWRHTRAHEYVFQLVKKMGYYCNQEAVREAHLPSSIKRAQSGWNGETQRGYPGQPQLRNRQEKLDTCHPSGRNPRSVLDIPTAPYKGAHYATFPPKLIAPLIRASVPRRCCPECGMAWAPVVERGPRPAKGSARNINPLGTTEGSKHKGLPEIDWSANSDFIPGAGYPTTVSDYRPTCECTVKCRSCDGHSSTAALLKNCTYCNNTRKTKPTFPEPGIVLDIFGGSGTTGMVAKQLLRRWVVMDISRPYLDEQSKIRTTTGTPSKMLKGLPLFEDIE